MLRKFSVYNKLIEDGYDQITKIQSLWSGYGAIYRMKNSQGNSFIVKHINPPKKQQHPRNWNTGNSHQRKLRSYQVEFAWYSDYQKLCNHRCKVPKLLDSAVDGSEQLLILEDLASIGYPILKSSIDLATVKAVLRWLANFHARFINHPIAGLWEIGSYWHLATRPDEHEVMQDGALKKYAHQIDEILNNCLYKTIIHGDAKLANFCFSENLQQVAAVDFQYVGNGCGMKDVAYFLGSCLNDSELEKFEEELLQLYFCELENNLPSDFNKSAVVEEWKSLYPFVWADFERFLLGWAPNHQKLTSYSQQMTEKVIKSLK
jgi:serine/threonine protein kinase